ncbi:hypothetical protein ACVBEQ_18650 [Nakamurella sp. GG22]
MSEPRASAADPLEVGSPASSVPRLPSDALLAISVTVAGAVIAWFRMPGSVLGQLYAEDGRTFFGDWLTHGGWSLWIEPYAGYQHLVPRGIAWFTMTFLPVTWWATAVNLLTCLVAGAVAGLVFVFSRDVVVFLPSRMAIGLVAVLTPVVGVEAVGNLANLHWFLLYLGLWVLLTSPRSALGAVGMSVVALLCTATEPQCAMFLPVAVWKLIESRRNLPVVIAWLIGVIAQVMTTLVSPRAVATDYPPIASTIEGYVLNVGMSLATNRTARLGAVLRDIGWWVGFVGVAIILGFAVYGFARGRLNAKVALGALLFGSAVSWTASFVLGSNPAFFYSEMTPERLADPPLVRWATAASIMLVATIPVTVGILADRSTRWRAPGLGIIVVLLAVMAFSIRSTNPVNSIDWESTVDGSSAVCALSPDAVVKVTTPPDPTWVVQVPCIRITG